VDLKKNDKFTILFLSFISSLISYFFVYGYEVTSFTLSIDEEQLDNFRQTLSLGRWGHALLHHYLLPEPYIPFFTISLAIIILAINASLAASYLELSKYHSIAFVIMLAALPQLAYQLEFNNQADTIAISLLLSTLSLCILQTKNKFKYLFFVALTILSLSIYQSVFLCAASLLCIKTTIQACKDNKDIFSFIRKIIIFCCLTLVALALNTLFSRLAIHYYGVPNSSYLSSMVGWGRNDINDVINTIIKSSRSFINFKAAYGLNAFAFCSVWIVGTFFALRKKNRKTTIPVIFCFVILLSTFTLNIMLGANLPPRAMMQVPFAFAGLYIIFIISCGLNRKAVIIPLFFLLNASMVSSKLFYSDHMARKADEQLSHSIITKIYSKYPSFDVDKDPVFFYGSYIPLNPWRIAKADTFGASFYEWDGGNNARIYNYLAISNIIRFTRPSLAEVERSIVNATNMPVWPHSDSILMVDGVVIVKLSNTLSPYNR